MCLFNKGSCCPNKWPRIEKTELLKNLMVIQLHQATTFTSLLLFCYCSWQELHQIDYWNNYVKNSHFRHSDGTECWWMNSTAATNSYFLLLMKCSSPLWKKVPSIFEYVVVHFSNRSVPGLRIVNYYYKKLCTPDSNFFFSLLYKQEVGMSHSTISPAFSSDL